MRELAKFGEAEAAELFRADPNEFNRRGKAGQQYFHGLPDENLPEWLHEIIQAAIACMMVSAPVPPGVQYAEEDGLHEVFGVSHARGVGGR
ncbi:MAG: hypothetical protein N2C14_01155 [Planctomycetales bacterium]